MTNQQMGIAGGVALILLLLILSFVFWPAGEKPPVTTVVATPVTTATPAPAAAVGSSVAPLASDERVSEAYRLEQEMCAEHVSNPTDQKLCQKVWQRGLLFARGILASARAEDEANQARREYERRERELAGALKAREEKTREDRFSLEVSNPSTGDTLAESKRASTSCPCTTLRIEWRRSCEQARARSGLAPCSVP